mgnify:CR=1 FL=1
MSRLNRLIFIVGAAGYLGGMAYCEYFISRRTEIENAVTVVTYPYDREKNIDSLLAQPAFKVEETENHRRYTRYAKYGITLALISMVPLLYGSAGGIENRDRC